MNSKKWTLTFFLFLSISIILVEIIYNLKNSNRHYVDYLVSEKIPNIKNSNIEIMILGDSVAANVFKRKKLKDNILDLSSNQAISMAGNYFFIKRILRKNKPPKKIYLFTIPQFYQNNLNQVWTYMYFETVFRNKLEIKEIKKILPNLYNPKNMIDRYFESRSNVLVSPLKNFKNTRLKHKMIKEDEIDNDLKYNSDKVSLVVKDYKKKYNQNLDIPRIYFNKIKKLCNEHNIELNVVIEPSPKRILDLFYSSYWYKYLTNSNINLYDINEYYQFSDIHFKDGVHIGGKVNDYYLQLINNNIFNVIHKDENR